VSLDDCVAEKGVIGKAAKDPTRGGKLMTTATVERKELYRVIEALPDDRLVVALDFVNSLREDQPNAETVAAIEELRAGKGERVTIEQIMAELNAKY
jgi:hypothetical protein